MTLVVLASAFGIILFIQAGAIRSPMTQLSESRNVQGACLSWKEGGPRWWSVGWACDNEGQQAHAPSATCSPLRHLEGLAMRYHSVKQTCTRQNLDYLKCEVNSVTCLVHLLLPLVPPPMLGLNSSTATAAASLFAKAR